MLVHSLPGRDRSNTRMVLLKPAHMLVPAGLKPRLKAAVTSSAAS